MQVNANSQQFMHNTINQSKNVFAKKKSQVDPSKTKIVEQDNGNIHVTTYYDKNGKELYSKTDIIKGYGGSIYSMKDDKGGTIAFHDYDRDGNMDRFDYRPKDFREGFQAFSTNDNGNYDKAFINSGKDSGKTISLDA